MGKNQKIILSIIIGVVGVIIIGVIVNSEIKRTSIYPLTFSEISQIKKEQGTNLGPITLYYATLNDICMKVFEAHNLSLDRGENGFAQELEIHVEPTFKIHKHNLPILLTNMPFIADKVLNKLTTISTIRDSTKIGFENLQNAWDDDHHDVYHTEYYTVTDTDSEGKTTTRTESRQVYDYTIHTYTFYPNAARQVDVVLTQMVLNYCAILFPEVLTNASITQAEGEYTTEKSYKHYVNKMNINMVTNLILGWNNKTTYNINLTKIVYYYAGMINYFNNKYIPSIPRSRSTKYKTYSSSDSGPIEFQINEQMVSLVGNIYKLSDEIITPIEEVKNGSIKYMDEINNYLDMVLNKHKNGNKSKIIKTAEHWYNDNFKNNDISKLKTFNVKSILMIVLAVMVMVGGIFWLWKNEIMG